MKFCYVDESGTGSEPYSVMAGVIVDAQRMHLTKRHWADLLDVLSEIVGRRVSELHARDFYSGNGIWRNIDGPARAALISAILKWLSARKHLVVYTAVDKAKFSARFSHHPYSGAVGSLWCLMALHLTLAIQKAHQSEKANKGHTVLIFDNEVREVDRFTQLVKFPPSWTDSYYRRDTSKTPPLDQLVDVPYFVDSRDVGLIQVADLLSYFLRSYLEMEGGVRYEKYDGEHQRLRDWYQACMCRFVPKSMTYPSRGKCACAEFFSGFVPDCEL